MMHSGAAHDTVSIVDLVPSAMVFVPCKDGISHSPQEDAASADAALGTEIMLNAIRKFVALPGWRNDGREPPPRS